MDKLIPTKRTRENVLINFHMHKQTASILAELSNQVSQVTVLFSSQLDFGIESNQRNPCWATLHNLNAFDRQRSTQIRCR